MLCWADDKTEIGRESYRPGWDDDKSKTSLESNRPDCDDNKTGTNLGLNMPNIGMYIILNVFQVVRGKGTV